jgi:hypothetical protein
VSFLKSFRAVGPALLILLVASAAIVSAGQPFTFGDVTGTEYYADAAYNLRDAGITNGCHGGADYCPGSDVSRGQMAAFLGRGLPGTIHSPYLHPSTGVNDADGLVTLRTIDVPMPGVDGVQYVLLQGQASVFINGEQDWVCSADPCRARLHLVDSAENQLAVGEFRVSSDDIGSSVHIEAVVPVASQAAPHRFQLKADTTNAAQDVYFIYQSITATTFPMNAAP